MVKTMDRKTIDRAAALLSYPIAYIYFYWFMMNVDFAPHAKLLTQWQGHFLFSVLFVLAVEGYAAAVGRSLLSVKTQKPPLFYESICLAALVLLQSLALLLYGPHDSLLAVVQVLFWHFTCIYYVCARAGILTSGRTGVFFLWDAVNGTIVVPFGHFFLRLICLFRREKKAEAASAATAEPKSILTVEKFRKAAVFCLTLVLVRIVCGLAWEELAGASDAFGQLGVKMSDFWAGILSVEIVSGFMAEYFPYFVLSIPIGAYLFGLVVGGLSDRRAMPQEQKLREGLGHFRILPAYSACLILGSLLAVYLLFFGVQTAELIGAISGKGSTPLRELVSAMDACKYAVSGFWQLVRVILLNFVVLLGFTVFSKVPLWENKYTRILIDLIFVCAAAFAVLAGYKLFVLYFYLYGPTPRRILSGWMVVMQLFWCILTLIRFHRTFPAVKIGVYTGAISFTALMLLDFDAICGYV